MALRAILFDHDGTLVDSEPVHFQTWVGVLAGHGVTLSEQQYITHYAGVPNRAGAIDIVQRFGLNLDPVALAGVKNDAIDEYLLRSAFPLMEDVLDAVNEFHRAGLTLAIVTGASSNAAHATLRAYDLQAKFATVVSGDDVRASKPAPDCYLLALERLGFEADECIAVEDTQHGLQAARGAGVPCIVVPTRMSRHHDFTGALAVLGSMAEAIAYVRNSKGYPLSS